MAERDVPIRQATLDDIASIVELNFALFQEDAGQRDPFMNLNWPKEEGQAHFSRLVSGSDSVCLLAEAGGEVIGYLAGYLWESGSLRPLKMVELESMYVRPHSRGQSIGRRLVNEFLKWSEQKGAQRVSVTAYAANARAIEFYRRFGFEPKCLSLEMRIKHELGG